MTRPVAIAWLNCAALFLAPAASGGIQSSMNPRGPTAERIDTLWWILFGGGSAILVIVMVFLAVAIMGPPRWRAAMANHAFIIGGGIAFPVVTLSILLIYGLVLMREETADGEGAVRITVTGEQWWWRVLYHNDDGSGFEAANEIRIPIGQAVEFTLATADVIHSFWVPNLAGKVDMIPGRRNKLTFTATSPGLSRGQCAEYCGGAHALMAFYVEALATEDYAAWRVREAGPAAIPTGPLEKRGAFLFNTSGCPACHTIRGSTAGGSIGPDLTHVGSRHSIAAGVLPNTPAAFRKWIADNQHIKPENRMPAFPVFTADDANALSIYLASLK